MKTRKLFAVVLFSCASIVFFFPSCTKEDENNLSQTDLTLAQDDAYADALYEEVDNLIDEEMTLLEKNGYSTDSRKSTSDDICYTVTVDHPDSLIFPKVVTIDYGDGCAVVFNGDTLVRKGQIIITTTARWFVEGSQHIVTFNNFYLNGIKVEGTKTRTNLGLNDENHLEWSIELEGGKLTFNDTLFMTRNSVHVREMIRKLNPVNDSIIVTGSANGMNVLGQTYTREIINPLILVHCDNYRWRWIIADGKVELTNSETGVTTIDYSGSGCDGEVIIEKNGNRYNYSFKYNRGRGGKGGN